MGTWERHGGFASSVTVDGRFAFQPPARHGPRGGGGADVRRDQLSTRRSGPTPPDRGSSVGILGVGGLGHLAIQFAHALGCEVTALSSSPTKEQEALAFGADHFVVTGDPAADGRASTTRSTSSCAPPMASSTGSRSS